MNDLKVKIYVIFKAREGFLKKIGNKVYTIVIMVDIPNTSVYLPKDTYPDIIIAKQV